MIKKWFEIINDHRISLRDRMFRIVTVTCMAALMLIMPMGRTIWNILVLAVSLAAMGLIVKLSIQKERIQTGATAITVLLLLLFPVSFFSAGGFYSGVPEWFIFCFIYVCLTLRGRRMAVFFVLCMAETLLCYAAAFYFPQLAARSTQQTSFFDSALSVIMVGFLTSVLLMFLNRMY
ncbi:MAG: fatty acid-binding protein DegV, partial [Acutalibacter sp.]|nr:fatty acid-binding protein DegV [Acutalibacter sp.]